MSRLAAGAGMPARALIFCAALGSVAAINFPGSRPPPSVNFLSGRQTVVASCTTSGTPPTVTLAAGESRQFTSSGYPANYPAGQSCTYNFQPEAGARLVFACADVDLAATSAVGARCTGDYLRFYDETGPLGVSGDRYCFNDKPSFTYEFNINILFKTNNDANFGRGNLSSQ